MNDLLCQVFIDDTLTDAALNAQYPIRFCHSPDDKVVDIANVPNITIYPNLSCLQASSDYSIAGEFCLLQALAYLATSRDLVDVNFGMVLAGCSATAAPVSELMAPTLTLYFVLSMAPIEAPSMTRTPVNTVGDTIVPMAPPVIGMPPPKFRHFRRNLRP